MGYTYGDGGVMGYEAESSLSQLEGDENRVQYYERARLLWAMTTVGSLIPRASLHKLISHRTFGICLTFILRPFVFAHIVMIRGRKCRASSRDVQGQNGARRKGSEAGVGPAELIN